MNEGDILLADIIAHPDDDGLRLIYADWLEDQGQEWQLWRAKVIRLGIKTNVARAYSATWKDTPAARWLEGAFGGLSDVIWHPSIVQLQTSLLVSRCGFIEGVVAPTCDKIPWEVIARNPVRWVTVADRVPGEAGWYLANASRSSDLPKAWNNGAAKWFDLCERNLTTAKYYTQAEYYQLLSDFLIWYSRNGAIA